MEIFLQGLQTNSSVLIALMTLFMILFIMHIKLGHRMEIGFKDVRAEIRELRIDFKGMKRRICPVEKKVDALEKKIK